MAPSQQKFFFTAQALTIALTSVALPKPAAATRLKPLSLHQLVGRADRIVRGRVKRVTARWNVNRSRIYTQVTLAVDSWIKKPHKQKKTVTLFHLGGKVGRYEMRVVGAPAFRRGQHVLVFLSRRNRRYCVTGMAQGKFTVKKDPRRNRKWVSRRLHEIKWVGGGRRPQGVFALETFVSRIQKLIRAPKKRLQRQRSQDKNR
jgi:hypothetical protein